MAQYRLVHVGASALLAAAAMTTVNVAQNVFAVAPSASSFVSIVPCRLADTRSASTVGTRITPIGAEETATLAVVGTNGDCLIPSAATAITANVTIDNPTVSSFLAVFPADADRGRTSNLNWPASSPPIANQVTVGLSTTGAINVFNNAGIVDVIIDVSGYYQPTNGGAGVPGPQGTQGPSGPQGDKGDTGDAVLAGLDCTTNQSIGWDGFTWVCRTQPVVATLSRPAFTGPPCCGIPTVFHAYSSNVDPTTPCSEFYCEISLIDVLDHTACQVNFTGNWQAVNLTVTPTTTGLIIQPLVILDPDQPVYVSILCVT